MTKEYKELINAIDEMKSGKIANQYDFNEFTDLRISLKLSQSKMADFLGISTKTWQSWEQGLKKPSAAAKSLLKITTKEPEVVRKILSA